MSDITSGGYPLALQEGERTQRLALHHLAQRGTAAAVQNAISSGADVSFTDGNGKTALHYAALVGKPDTAAALMTCIAVEVQDNDGRTALLDAAQFAAQWPQNPGGLQVVQALLNSGANPSAADIDGFAPLMAAAYFSLGTGAADLCQMLIDGRADTQATDCKGWNALHWAANRPEPAQVSVIDVLAKAGCWINLTSSDDGSAPLHLAVRYDAPLVMVDAMLLMGADPLQPNFYGQTPAGMARDKGKEYAEAAKRLAQAAKKPRHTVAAPRNGMGQV